MTYQVRQRDPLIDANLQIVLTRRAREGFGVALALLGLLMGAMLVSYDPADPWWLAATDAAPTNWLGTMGATVAGPLMMILGWGSFAVAGGLIVWGLRFAMHWGAERALPRSLFVLAWAVVCALYAATLVPPAWWDHDFGMGGLLGEMGMGMILSALPLTAPLGLKLVALILAVAVLWSGTVVLGFTRDEVAGAARFLATGALAALGQGAHLTRRGSTVAARGAATGAGSAGRHALTALRARRNTHEARGPRDWFAFLRRARPETGGEIPEDEGTDEDRVRSRIADAVRARLRRAQGAARDVVAPEDHAEEHGRAQPVLTRSRRMAQPEDAATPEIVDPIEPMIEDAIEDAAPAPAATRVVKAPVRKALTPRASDSIVESGVELPPLDLLTDPSTVERHVLSDDELEANARALEAVLDDYGVKGEIVSVRPGPVVTMYELEPAPGLKASRVIGLSDDIARSMSALSARVSTVPGRSVIGIELPNEKRERVVLREILSAPTFADTPTKLPLALGKDIGGAPIVADLARMPHLLIAGTTGSGKSVAINTMILSLLYRLTPEQCRLIMIDPKMLELSVYDGIPHLLSPVVTDPKKAVVALKWTVAEMEERYRKMSKMGVRNIEGYNGRVRETLARGEMFERTVQTGFDDETGDPVFETEVIEPVAMPYIVVVVDEMADLMMVAGKEIEACIQRLAQMARASGIHLIMATQRPSVDVITGTIKANFPTRISFQVTSKIDSRTILGEMGAEQLLGQGDMLYMAGGAKITRVHGPFCSDEEVEEIVAHLKTYGPPQYVGSVQDGPEEKEGGTSVDEVLGLSAASGPGSDAERSLYDQAVDIVARDRKCSTSYIQRKLGIGYNKAARLVEQMEDEGVVTAANHVGKRDILVPEA